MIKKIAAALVALMLLLASALPALAVGRDSLAAAYAGYEAAIAQNADGAGNVDPILREALINASMADLLGEIAELVEADPAAVAAVDRKAADGGAGALALLIANAVEPTADAQTAFDAWAVIASHYGTTIFRNGRGRLVQNMQNALLAHNPASLPRYGADGGYGAESAAAVRAFQMEMGLPATGVYDWATRALLGAGTGADPIHTLMRATAKALDDGRPIGDTTTTLWIAGADERMKAALNGAEPFGEALSEVRLSLAYAIGVLLLPWEGGAPEMTATPRPAPDPTAVPAPVVPAPPATRGDGQT